jgi:hypothetical protein
LGGIEGFHGSLEFFGAQHRHQEVDEKESGQKSDKDGFHGSSELIAGPGVKGAEGKEGDEGHHQEEVIHRDVEAGRSVSRPQ